MTGTQPKLAYSIPVGVFFFFLKFNHIRCALHLKANSDIHQDLIWAFGTIPPSSSAVDATLQQHVTSGTLSLDLSKSIPDPSTADTPADNPSTSGVPSTTTINPNPLTRPQKLIVAHAILCAVGFLFFLPAGALLARYFRTFSSSWFQGHWITQFAISMYFYAAAYARHELNQSSPRRTYNHRRCGLCDPCN
jgi:hypothetical protein